MPQMRVLVITLFVFQCLSTLGSSQSFETLGSSKSFDFFYLVQQWPGSYCDTEHGCCYPTTGKPAENFTIHGLWPEYKTGKWPQYCNRSNSLDVSQISDLVDGLQKDWPSMSCPSENGTIYWSQQWKKHGTCSSLDQHAYFQAALHLKDKTNLLQALKNAGIYPGGSYSLESIKEAIKEGAGYEPYIQCNTNAAGNIQLYQVYLCVDTSASYFIECPFSPKKKCNSSTIAFPSFSSEPLRVVNTESLVTSY